jgi:hypothetical protein
MESRAKLRSEPRTPSSSFLLRDQSLTTDNIPPRLGVAGLYILLKGVVSFLKDFHKRHGCVFRIVVVLFSPYIP